MLPLRFDDDREQVSFRPVVPAVSLSGFANKATDDDDRMRTVSPCLHGGEAAFGASGGPFQVLVPLVRARDVTLVVKSRVVVQR